jgi:phosphate transport system substrate-binding protein
MTTSLTANDLFHFIERSGLLAPEQLAPYQIDPTTPETLARQLIKDRLLTPMQASNLLRRRYRGFFLTEKYKILAPLGAGGMGRVLLCEHLILRKLVAVKLLALPGAKKPGTSGGHSSQASHAEAHERFLREARAAALLDDPHIVRVYDVDWSGSTPFIVMEFVDGSTLQELVVNHGPLAVERASAYTCQAASALMKVYKAGLVHRDVKPGNLLLERSGTVKLSDLGLARFFAADKDDHLTERFEQAAVLGSTDFLAPEQALASKKVDIRADIYALGCTLYYLLSGQSLFGGGTAAQKLLWHQMRPARPIQEVCPAVPAELAAVLERMIQKEPAARYQTPAELLDALAPWATLQVPPPAEREMPAARSHSFLLGLAPPVNPALVGLPAVEVGAPAVGSALRNTPGPHSTARNQPRAAAITTPAALPTPLPVQAPLLPGNRPLRTRLTRPVVFALVGLGTFLLALLGGGTWALQSRTIPNQPSPQPDPEAAPAAKPAVVASGVSLRGGGSTFVAPLMRHWTPLYEKQVGGRIEYKGMGSSKGIAGMTDQFLDFGCTDAPMTDAQLARARQARGEVIHVPLALGAVVPTYNLPGTTTPLRFTGPLLADIYLGKVKRWNDQAIALNNPGQALPDLPITVVHRAEGSGTTFIWTDYLSKASAQWREKVGKGTTVPWPVGQAGKGNDGVVTAVTRTTGAIGYVELTYALSENLPAGHVKNRDGVFVAPTLESVTAAAAAALQTIPDDLRFSLTDAPGQAPYPIAGSVWAVLYLDQPTERGAELARFFRWATHEGQHHMRALCYAPLPDSLVKRIEAKLSRIQGAR